MMRTTIRFNSALIFFSFCTLYLIILFNLFLIQIWNRTFFSSLGTHQYQLTITQLPVRAPIYDRNGTAQPLAVNKECVSAFIVPNKLGHKEALTQFLQEHFPKAYQQFLTKQNRSFMYVKRRLSQDEIQLIKDAACEDIHLLSESSRFYPLPCAAPIVGFTDVDNKGLAGIELQCNRDLTGKASTCYLEKDARSGCFYFKKELKHAGTQSKPTQLTIDNNLQFLVDEELAATMKQYNAQEGAAIIMDPVTGEILSLVSRPYDDPNTGSFDIANLKPRGITESYERGSVMKVFAALAALEEQVVTPQEIIDCKNSKTCTIDGRTINTLKAHGRIPFADVIAFSNNIGIAQVAKRLNEKLYDHYTRIGFGSKTGISLPGEQGGLINHPSNWSKQSIISLSYGYEISSTLLQLACAFSMIANEGHPIIPKIIIDGKPQEIRKKLYQPKTITTIKDILRKTTKYGTGWRFQLKGYDIMSKTGTANLLENGTYNQNKNIFTCASIIEKGPYKRVIVSYIKETQTPNAHADTVAVPLQKRIAEKMIIHERVI
ncbi:penicillin-binding protein 2 [Candidatus Dependentiae bacterium]|nr:MAG: penicillin-binding protein 2 [Candidatus Dependentiae bacterium]